MRISDWSSDVCSSDLPHPRAEPRRHGSRRRAPEGKACDVQLGRTVDQPFQSAEHDVEIILRREVAVDAVGLAVAGKIDGMDSEMPGERLHVPHPVPPRSDAAMDQQQRRSEEHTSELQSLMRTSYAVFCLKTKRPRQTP